MIFQDFIIQLCNKQLNWRSLMQEKKTKLAELLKDFLKEKPVIKTSVKGLTLFKAEESFPRSPFKYNSEIVILAQGKKNVYLGNNVYTYDPSRYLVLPVPLPVECEGITDSGEPIIGLSIVINPIEIGEILLEMENTHKEVNTLPKGIYSAPMNDTLYDATIRLVQALSSPADQKVLAPMIKREIIYRIIQGEKGEILQALAHGNKRFFQIAKVLQKIHKSYSEDFDIENMAQELDMSSSTFHSSFKAVTDTSPLQYIKNVRLHKARTLMLHDGLNANMASIKVGYESASQFSREYKRLFGVTPAKDAAVLRRQQAA